LLRLTLSSEAGAMRDSRDSILVFIRRFVLWFGWETIRRGLAQAEIQRKAVSAESRPGAKPRDAGFTARAGNPPGFLAG
jgi:threonine/homoserine/homoserine lactone efflux protein